MPEVYPNRFSCICETCRQPFSVPAYRKGTAKFCSSECKHASQTIPLSERFKSKLSYPNENGCILWLGEKNKGGYGLIQIGNNPKCYLLAHRLAMQLSGVHLPEGCCVCHHCDNPGCVNADHLFLGTQRDNVKDMLQKGRNSAKKRILSQKQAAEIRIKYISEKTSYSILAKEYGVSIRTISNIIHNYQKKPT